MQARVGEVEMCLRVVARPGVQVEHAASRDDREVRLPRRNGNLPLHILLVLLRDDNLVAGLIALRPRHRRQNRHAQRGRRLRLHAGHDGRRACACIEFHRVGEVGRQGRGERRERRGPHLLEDCFGAHDARGRLRDGRVVLRRAIDRLSERQALHRLGEGMVAEAIAVSVRLIAIDRRRPLGRGRRGDRQLRCGGGDRNEVLTHFALLGF